MSDSSNEINIEDLRKLQKCEAVTYQSATVCVPVTVTPSANAGCINTFCCGEPYVSPCAPALKCCENSDGSCRFVVTQNICIEIPIEFGAKAYVGDPSVECGKATGRCVCKETGK